jgi:recX family
MRTVRTRKQVTPEQALVRLEELCVRAERCEAELRQKMALWVISPEDADNIIMSLRNRRFLDENRFAAAFVRDKYRFGKWGRRRIIMAMKQKNIPAGIIDSALGEIDQDEYIRILAALLRYKAKTMPRPLEFDDRNKLFRFAIGRGFEPDLIISEIKTIQ